MPVHSFQLLDGTSIPWLAWGNGSALNGSEDAIEKGTIALQNGINHIDTAQWYETEAETAVSIKRAGLSKDQVYVTSKLSWVTDGKSLTLEQARNRIEESLEKLECVPDLFLIHNPFVAVPGELKQMWKILENFKDEGKLKNIGVSNFRPQDLETILGGAKYTPVVNQLEFHPYLLAHLEPVLEIHKKHGIITESYGSLTPLIRHPTGGPLRAALEMISTRISTTAGKQVNPTAVLLLWIRAQGAVAVTASGNAQRLQWLGEVAKLPQLLTEEEIERITNIGKTVHFRHYREHMEKDFPLPSLPSQ
ncbi:NADPH-dependent conjugated polyketone reductase C1 [Leucoagaricus sp. SymC.cos]|nr:NADPH-dependent conjugated polyketone reductase C1 [Leucoagaricus sp. SymC.cos]